MDKKILRGFGMDQQGARPSVLRLRDKLGYAFGDLGCQLTFALVGPFISMFYTDILGISPPHVMVLLLVARIWDAVSDPLWGGIVDHLKPSRHGRFRPWLAWAALPMALSAVLMFTNPGFSATGCLLWAYGSYILNSTCYTLINIPYGSLASVISPHEGDRSALSMFRNLGSGIGSLPAMALLPLIVYTTDEAGNQHLDGEKLWLGVVVLSAASVVMFLLSFAFTKERVVVPRDAAPPQTRKTIQALLRNRPFIILCLASMLHIGVVLYSQTVNNYLFKDYFRQPGLYSLYSVFTYAPMALLIPLIGPLVRRFGRKEVCSAGILFSVAAYVLAWLLRVENPYIYLGLCFLNGFGLTCFTMEVWAIVTDVIDFQYLLSGQRDEATAFGFYYFARKIGHTAAGSGGALILTAIGYKETVAGQSIVQSAEVARGLYTAATLVPAIALLLMFLLMAFAYPLGQVRLKEMRAELAALRPAEV